MFLSQKSMLFLAAAFTFSGVAPVNAQKTTATSVALATSTATGASGPSGVDPCLLQCADTAATNAGCADATDVKCICSSDTVKADTLACLKSSCPASVVAQAAALQTQECAGVSASASTADGDSTVTAVTGDVGNTSRNVASVGASVTSIVSSITHSIASTSHASSASSSAAVTSASGFPSGGADLSMKLGGVLGVAIVLSGIALGALAV